MTKTPDVPLTLPERIAQLIDAFEVSYAERYEAINLVADLAAKVKDAALKLLECPGKTDAERRSVLLARHPELYVQLQQLETQLSGAKVRLELAELSWDACRYHKELLVTEARYHAS